MIRQCKELVFQLIRDGNASEANGIVMAPPYLNSSCSEEPILDEAQQREIWLAIIDNTTEDDDLRNLISGAKLRMSNPKAADMPCSTCRKLVVDTDKFEVYRRPGGLAVPRSEGSELMCDTKKGCARGHWERPIAFSQKNTLAWNHYWEWRQAGMPIPECAIQRRNWSILHWITNGCSRQLCPTIRSTA